jgi:VWFA-related protein
VSSRNLSASVLALVVAGAAFPFAQAGGPVALAVSATDRGGRLVRGLTEADFAIRENGKPVAVESVRAVTPVDAEARGRSIVLLLGASGVDPSLTSRVQAFANDFVRRSGPNDRVSVVRFARSNDEVAGSRNDMLMRIAEYNASYGEPLNAKTHESVLRAIAKISRQFDTDAPSRRAIIWIGSPFVFDVPEPELKERELIWRDWVAALNATARANVSLYVLDPVGLTGRVRISPDGLVAQTGGRIFDNTNNLDEAIDWIWQEIGSYYEVAYLPDESKRELQSIAVKVSKPGVDIRARRLR